MNKFRSVATLATLLLLVFVTSSLAATGHEHHMDAAGTPMMAMPEGGHGDVMPCQVSKGHGGHDMMSSGMMGNMMSGGRMGRMMSGGMMSGSMMENRMSGGRMAHRMDHMFFLDRIEALKLSDQQVTRLKEVRSACRSENIRQAAEARIARIELAERLDGRDWSVKEMETLVRRLEKLEADMFLRHLQAIQDARAVLTADQLEQADQAQQDVDLEELFRQ